MPSGARYRFIVSMDVAPDKETLFNQVYDEEHIPNLMKVPGVLGVTRVKGEPFALQIGGERKEMAHTGPAYTAIYELESADVLASDAWAEAVEAGRWPGEVRPFTTNRRLENIEMWLTHKDGGTVCMQLGNVAADNINARAQGFRDTISGEKGIDRLTGQNGWSEIEGCPLYTNDQIDLANQQMSDTFLANPDLSAFILVGGWAQFGPNAYAQVTDQVKAKLDSKELIIIAGDTLPPQMDALKAGRSHAQIGQRPFEMGHRAPDILIELIKGMAVEDPLYTGLDECTAENMGSCP